jgi:hypothetical protein
MVWSSWQTAAGEVLDASTQFSTSHVQAERLASFVGGKSLLITWSFVSHLLSGFANGFTGFRIWALVQLSLFTLCHCTNE